MNSNLNIGIIAIPRVQGTIISRCFGLPAFNEYARACERVMSTASASNNENDIDEAQRFLDNYVTLQSLNKSAVYKEFPLEAEEISSDQTLIKTMSKCDPLIFLYRDPFNQANSYFHATQKARKEWSEQGYNCPYENKDITKCLNKWGPQVLRWQKIADTYEYYLANSKPTVVLNSALFNKNPQQCLMAIYNKIGANKTLREVEKDMVHFKHPCFEPSSSITFYTREAEESTEFKPRTNTQQPYDFTDHLPKQWMKYIQNTAQPIFQMLEQSPYNIQNIMLAQNELSSINRQ